MATGTYYVVYIEMLKDKTYDDIKTKMDLALDWFRVKDDLWILYSTSDAEKLKARLLPLVKSEGRLFICKLDITERNGWMAKSFWEWLRKDRLKEEK